MIHQNPPQSADRETSLPPVVRAGLLLLAEAKDFGRDAQCDMWQFALELGNFQAVGLNLNGLRWLLSRGLIQHAREITRPEDTQRRFMLQQNMAFDSTTCFILTEAGASLVDQLRDVPVLLDSHANLSENSAASLATRGEEAQSLMLCPRWDSDLRVLRLGQQVIKRYRVASPNQELVLASFESRGWPQRIETPFVPQRGQDTTRRLHDTVKCLNQHQANRLIQFRGDGTGKGVLWELIAEAANVGPNPNHKLRTAA